LPQPVPGQTIGDVCDAEARFVEEVAVRHPNAEGKPCLIGNYQAGWQIMMMSAVHLEQVGPFMLVGSPLSYWAGVHGKRLAYAGRDGW
jgi:predicted alpha/beta hydrolase